MSYNLFNLPPLYTTPQLLFGTRKRDYPFEFDKAHFTVEEHYLVKKGNYTQQARNTPNTLYPTAFLVDETVEKEEGDGVWFVRHYSTVPATWREYQTYVGTFPGFLGVRVSFSGAVKAALFHEYFMVGDGLTYTTVDDIPALDISRVSYPVWLWARQPLLGGDDIILRDAGGGLYIPTSPTKTEYAAWVTADALTDTSYSLVAEPSKPVRYKGNIWDRQTLYVKAL